MSLYDYLMDEQVKCFFNSFIYKSLKEDDTDSYEICTSGGQLRGYSIGEKVPYVTPYYNYSPNFIVFDYRNNENKVHVFQNGLFEKSIEINDVETSVLTKMDLPNTLVVDNFGKKIKINLAEDFSLIAKEHKTTYDLFMSEYKNIKSLRDEHFDNIVKQKTINNGYEKAFNKIHKKYIDSFIEKWHSKENLHLSNFVGTIISCHELNETEDVQGFLSQYSLSELNQNIDSYIEWSKDNELISSLNINQILSTYYKNI